MIRVVKTILLSIAITISFFACNSSTTEETKDVGVKFNPSANTDNSTKMSDAERERKIAEKKMKFDAKQSINLMDNFIQFNGKIKLTVMIPADQGLSDTEMKLLESKLMQMVAANGIGGIGGNPRFIITPVFNVLKKDVTSTAPVKHVLQTEVTFYVADILTGSVYGTYALEFTGIGQSDQLALTSGFHEIKPRDSGFQEFIKSSQEKILKYYIDNGDRIITEANTLVSQRKYNQALAILESIPMEAEDVYKKAAKTIPNVFQKYLDNECETILAMMKSALGTYNEMSAAGFNPEAMGYYKMIPNGSKCKPEADRIYANYKKNLNPKAVRDWEKAEKEWQQKIAQHKSDNEFRTLQEKMKARIAVEGNACLLDKYKKDAAYNKLPWLRKLIHLGDYDPFDGHKQNAGC